MKRLHLALAWTLLWLGGPFLHAEPPQVEALSGKAIRVIDGDTLELLVQRQPVRVRLNHIDAPEQGQPFGDQARRQLAGLCAGVFATVSTQGQDRYGRTIGEVNCAGRHANEYMVAQGWAWVYRHYAPANSPLLGLEMVARELRLGLWSDPQPPVPPWDWRRQQRNAVNR